MTTPKTFHERKRKQAENPEFIPILLDIIKNSQELRRENVPSSNKGNGSVKMEVNEDIKYELIQEEIEIKDEPLDITAKSKCTDATDFDTRSESSDNTPAEPYNDDEVDRGSMLTEPCLTLLGGKYYAARRSRLTSWVKVLLLEVFAPESFNSSLFRYDIMERGTFRTVTGDCIAYSLPASTVLETGCRVVAHRNKITSTGGGGRGYVYPGVVLEVPQPNNNDRYLIYFENGAIRYLSPKSVYKVFQQNCDITKYIPEEDQNFIERCIQKAVLPLVESEYPFLTLYSGGEPEVCTVLRVDCSIALIYSSAKNHIEWIHRGSPRLFPKDGES